MSNSSISKYNNASNFNISNLSNNMNMNMYSMHGNNSYNTQPNHNILPLANLSNNLTNVLNPCELNRDPNSAFCLSNNKINNNSNINIYNNNNCSYIKSKRIAISAEPAQNFFNRSKDSKITLAEYKKNES